MVFLLVSNSLLFNLVADDGPFVLPIKQSCLTSAVASIVLTTRDDIAGDTGQAVAISEEPIWNSSSEAISATYNSVNVL